MRPAADGPVPSQNESRRLSHETITSETHHFFLERLSMRPRAPPYGTYVKSFRAPADSPTYTRRIIEQLGVMPNLAALHDLQWDAPPTAYDVPAKLPRLTALSIEVSRGPAPLPLAKYFNLDRLTSFGLKIDVPSPTILGGILGSIRPEVTEIAICATSADQTPALLQAIRHRTGLTSLKVEPTMAGDVREQGLAPSPLVMFPKLRRLHLSDIDPLSSLELPHAYTTLETLVLCPLREEPEAEVPSDTEGAAAAAEAEATAKKNKKVSAKRRAELAEEAEETARWDEQTAHANFPKSHPVRVLVDRLVILLKAHPTRFPALREVGLQAVDRDVLFDQLERRRLAGYQEMAAKLRSVGITLLDQRGVAWPKDW